MRKGYQITIITNPPDAKYLKEAKCPNCKTKIGYYTNGKPMTHRCTVCNEESTF